MAIKLTKTQVDNIPHPKSGQVFYRDSILTGFGLRVGRSTKAYYAEKRIKGKTRRVTVGDHGQITTEQARREAQRLLGMMATGQNPNEEEKQAKAKTVTLKEAFDEFMDARKSLKARTIYDYNYVLDNYAIIAKLSCKRIKPLRNKQSPTQLFRPDSPVSV